MNSVKEFSRCTLPFLICALICSPLPVSAQQPQPPRQDRITTPTPAPRATPQARPTPVAPATTPSPQSSPPPNATPQSSSLVVAANPATSAVEFAELLAAENYMMVGEMSGIVEVANSNLVADALAPFERLGEVPKEVVVLREFLTRHAETMETTRVSFAVQPMRPGLPQIIIRVQCADAEAARKIEAPLKNLLRTVLAAPPPPPPPAPKPKATATSTAPERATPSSDDTPTNSEVKVGASAAPTDATNKEASSGFKLKVIDRSIFVSDADFKLADLRAPASESSLAESSRYNNVRTRFAAEPLFIFYDLKLLERTMEEAAKKQRAMMEQMEKEQAEKKPSAADPAVGETATVTALPAPADADNQNAEDVAAPVEMTESTEPEIVSVVPANPDADSPPSEMATNEEEAGMGASSRGSTDLMNILLPSLFGGSSFTNMLGGAEALGVGVSLNADAISVRTLMLTPEKNYVSPIPFLPQVVAGAANSSRAASLLPADTEIFVNTALDLPKSFDKFLEATEKEATSVRTPTPRRVTNGVVEASDAPAEATADTLQVNSAAIYVAGIEAQLNFKIRDDLLATFGSEFAFGLLPPAPAPSPDEKKSAEVKQASVGNASDEDKSTGEAEAVNAPSGEYGFVGLISVTDKARLQTLLPKAVELFGIKMPGVTAANLFERRGDIEYLRFAPGVAAAFIGDFLVVASDDATLQRIVATTTGERSLAGDNAFVSGRAWQPRDKLGEIYVRGGATDKLFSDDRKWVSSVVGDIEPFFADFTQDQAPLTLALTGEADGSLHEIRIPRSLIVSTMAHAAADAKHGEKVRNERSITYRLQSIAGAQETFHEKNKRYGSLEELRKAEMYYYPADEDTGGYRIALRVSTDDFSATASPVQYGVTGRRSYYIDKSGTLRAGDHGGKAADATDPVVK